MSVKAHLENCKVPYWWQEALLLLLFGVYFFPAGSGESSAQDLCLLPCSLWLPPFLSLRSSNMSGCFSMNTSDCAGLKSLLHYSLDLRYWEVTWLVSSFSFLISKTLALIPPFLKYSPLFLWLHSPGWMSSHCSFFLFYPHPKTFPPTHTFAFF